MHDGAYGWACVSATRHYVVRWYDGAYGWAC